MRDRGSDERTETGHSRFRGKPTGKRSGRGRGGKTNAANLGMPAGGREETTNSVRLRPTHCKLHSIYDVSLIFIL